MPDIPFEVIDTGFHGSYDLSAGIHVARHQSELEALWARVHGREGEPPPPPVIARPDTVAVLVQLGARRSSGYAVRIERVTATPTGVTVEALETTPGPLHAVARVMTAPYQMVIMPRFDGTAALSMRTEARK